MALPKNLSKFSLALVEFLTEQQIAKWSFQETEKPRSMGHQFEVLLNTGMHRLNADQRAHIKGLTENLVPSRYSVEMKYFP